jgi:hypothetical protein
MPLYIAHYIAENQRLTAAMATMGGSSSAGGHFVMPVLPIPPARLMPIYRLPLDPGPIIAGSMGTITPTMAAIAT